MKTTIVPAQITTVEDKIAGSLSLSQLALLAAPIFVDSAIYIIFPPSLRFEPYKIMLIAIMFFLGSLMAIRIKGKILLIWLVTIGRYNLRPRYYVADKNAPHLRPLDRVLPEDAERQKEEKAKAKAPLARAPRLNTADLVAVEQLMANPGAHLTFKPAKKGGLNVVITEVE